MIRPGLYWGLIFVISAVSWFCIGYGKAGKTDEHSSVFVVGIVLFVVVCFYAFLGGLSAIQ